MNEYCYDYFKELGISDITFIVSTPKEYEEAQQLGATKLAIDSNSKYASKDGLCLIDNGKLILFIGKDLTEYTIPESVTSIRKGVFNGCSRLTSITIPNSVTSIGDDAFKGCSKLKSFNGKFASEDGRCLIKDGELIAFAPAELTSYTIPNSVTSIGYSAFAYCSSLKSITIPNSVTSIGDDAFKGCSSLKSITIPNSVTSIGYAAFRGCSSLKSVKVANKYCYDYFKDNVANIAFYGANASADGRCLIIDGELKIFIAKGITEYTIPNSVTSIGYEAFYKCSSLTSITIPDSVTKIGGYAFEDYKIQSIIIDTVTGNTSYLENYFGANKISGYTGKYVSSDGCCLIKDNVLVKFLDRKKVSYTIPDSVTEIGEYAFDGCSGLTTITISESVTKIGNNAFVGCKNLYRMTCYASVPPIIDSFGEYMIIYVSKEAIKAYKKDPKWSIYKKQIKAIK